VQVENVAATKCKGNLSELNEKVSNCGCYKLNAVHKTHLNLSEDGVYNLRSSLS